MDGLFAEIRSVILVQRPDSLDTAYTLALLQEEAMDSNKQRSISRGTRRPAMFLILALIVIRKGGLTGPARIRSRLIRSWPISKHTVVHGAVRPLR
jgi:hypothetical protein